MYSEDIFWYSLFCGCTECACLAPSHDFQTMLGQVPGGGYPVNAGFDKVTPESSQINFRVHMRSQYHFSGITSSYHTLLSTVYHFVAGACYYEQRRSVKTAQVGFTNTLSTYTREHD